VFTGRNRSRFGAGDGVVRCVDLKRIIKERFDVDLDEVSIGRVLKELGFAHLSPRPQHPGRTRKRSRL
jgi:transposase